MEELFTIDECKGPPSLIVARSTSNPRHRKFLLNIRSGKPGFLNSVGFNNTTYLL